eukprot:COSAG01_NODE_106_length_26062_cov_141.222509_3_plen_140_part_00
MDQDDVGRRVKDEAERMLREGVHRQIHGAYDALGHSLVIPGMEVEHEEGSSDLVFGHCAKCHTELRTFDPTHPAFESFQDQHQGTNWTCDVCNGQFILDSPDSSLSQKGVEINRMFCCPTFVVCNWKACAECQNSVNDA